MNRVEQSERVSTLDADLGDIERRLRGQPRANAVIAEMWAYNRELAYQSEEFARAKTYFECEVAKVVIAERSQGEKSAEVARQKADLDPDIYKAKLAWRLAEQKMLVAVKALHILHAELDKIRTDRADQRKADAFNARTQP